MYDDSRQMARNNEDSFYGEAEAKLTQSNDWRAIGGVDTQKPAQAATADSGKDPSQIQQMGLPLVDPIRQRNKKPARGRCLSWSTKALVKRWNRVNTVRQKCI